MQSIYKNKKERNTFVLLLVYSAFVFMFDGDETKVRLIYLAYGLLCLNLIFRCRKIKIYRLSLFYIGYLFFGLLSIIWAEDANEAYIRSRTVFILLVLYLLLTTYSVISRNMLPLIISIMVGSIALAGYMFVSYGFSGIMSAVQLGGSRLGDLINNVNAVGNALSIGMIALLGVAIFYKRKLLLLLFIPMLISLLVTGSRTASITLIVGVLILLLCMLKKKPNSSKRLIQMLITFIVVVTVFAVMKSLPATQELVLRIEDVFYVFTGRHTVVKETSAQTRFDFIELGWRQFLRSPIWGNGIGCAGYSIKETYGYVTYLHNNYIEILASGGLIGFFLFYTPYFLIIIYLWRIIFVLHDYDPVLIISFALISAKLVGHFGTVVYYSKIEYLLLALWTAVYYHDKNKRKKFLNE